jgi:hypothetical protein
MKTGLIILVSICLFFHCFSLDAGECKKLFIDKIYFNKNQKKLSGVEKGKLNNLIFELLKHPDCMVLATSYSADLCEKCAKLSWDRTELVLNYLKNRGIRNTLKVTTRLESNANYITLDFEPFSADESTHPNLKTGVRIEDSVHVQANFTGKPTESLTSTSFAQSNSDSLIFIKIGSIYRSNLIDFSSSQVLMLKFKTVPDSFSYDKIFCDLSKGKFRSSRSINDNDIVDSLSKQFNIYKVEFENTQSGRMADSMVTKSNYYTGYLFPLELDQGVVTHYILQRWTGKFTLVKYKLTNWDCNDNSQCCIVKIEAMK